MTDSALVIRSASLQDVSALQSLARDCVIAMRAAGIEQWDEVYPSHQTILQDIAAETLDVLCEQDIIIACITVDSCLDPLWQGLDWNADSDTAAAVHRLMVHPTKQGLGHAKRLMLDAEKVARRRACRSIRLDSFLRNPPAMGLYPRLGYRRTGTAMMRKGEFAGFEKLLPIRAMVAADIPAALDLWQHTEGVGLTNEETPEMLVSFLERNPGISSVACLDGRLVGAVLGGHDGRRGYVYHLAVATEYRGHGLARSLVDRTVFQFGVIGLLRATIMVYATNHDGQSFWRHLGWRPRLDLMPMQIPMKPHLP